jgi:hypothetical protein
MNVVEIGTPPFDRQELIDSLEEFATLYKDRPIEDNHGGMCAPHMFGAWFMARKLQPQTIIESGVWYGQGTWFFEKAAPDARIFCIDPNLERIKYKSSKAQYIREDFSRVEWGTSIDCATTLCFFDDHQNAVSRLEQAAPQGFRHLMFEDNYPRLQGDCVSLKTVLEEDSEDGKKARGYLLNYNEIPPVVKVEKTRWGDDWTDEFYPTLAPLLEGEVDEKYSVYVEDSDTYTWLCYTQTQEKDV